MKKIILTIAVLSLTIGCLTKAKSNNQVVLNVSLCDTTQGSGDLFAEIYGTDNLGIVQDYTMQQDSGTIVFQDVASGIYEIAVYKEGFALHKDTNVMIDANYQESIVLQENTPPAGNFIVDSLTLVSQWESPQLVILNEDFENSVFPPANWQAVGFTRGNNLLFPAIGSWPSFFAVEPVHNTKSEYAELITPPVDLRQASHFKISFDYFFKASYGGGAMFQASFDNGATWEFPYWLSPNPSWTNETIDLDMYSGVGGKRSAIFKFEFEYSWAYYNYSAIDNVMIYSEVASPDNYSLMLDNQLVDIVPDSVLTYNFGCLAYGEQHQASITANYGCGYSYPATYNFTSKYLPIVETPFISYIYGDSMVELTLQPVNMCDSAWKHQGLLAFNINRDDDTLFTIPFDSLQGYVTIVEDKPGIREHHYSVSALYDLGYWGFPGQTAESAIVTDTVFVAYGKSIPFTEDWNSGDFEFNNWIADSNFTITNDVGTPAPSVQFSPPENSQSFQQHLTSDNMLTDRFKVGVLWLDFDVKPQDSTINPNQYLSSQIRSGNGSWISLEAITSTENNDWETKHYNITSMMSDNVPAVRFESYGNGGNPFHKWYIDNIIIYRTCATPTELTAKYIWDGTFGVRIRWHFTKSSINEENRGLSGFNLYRGSENMSDYELYSFIPYTSDGYYEYKDLYPSVTPEIGYYYKVSTLCADGLDTLESEFAHSATQPDSDFVYVLVTGEKEISTNNKLTIYPNPAKNTITISSPFVMDKTELFSNDGRMVFRIENYNSKTCRIDISRLDAGIYYVIIWGENKMLSGKIIVE